MSEGLTILEFPRFTLQLSEAFGSNRADHRERLNQSIGRVGSSSLVSVAHSRVGGGFAHSENAAKLGFDLESTPRILRSKLNCIARYSAERKLAPAIDLLWTAKEAALKALGTFEVDRLSKLFIRDWVEIKPGVFEFSVTRTKEPEVILPGQGLSFRHESFCISVFSQTDA